MPEEKKKPEMRGMVPGVAPGGKTAAKPKKKLSGGAIAAILLVVAIIGFGAAVYFNLGGTKQMVASALGLTTVENASAQESQQAADAQASFDKQQAEIKSAEESLSQKEEELKQRESDLNTREQEVAARESEAAAAVSTADQQAQTDKDLDAAAEIFAKMEVTSAAKAISGMGSVTDMAAILRRMPSEQAALIMEKMNSSLVTKILSEMVG